MAQMSLPSVTSGEGGLNRYMEEIRRFPMLEPQEEYMLAKRYVYTILTTIISQNYICITLATVASPNASYATFSLL